MNMYLFGSPFTSSVGIIKSNRWNTKVIVGEFVLGAQFLRGCTVSVSRVSAAPPSTNLDTFSYDV